MIAGVVLDLVLAVLLAGGIVYAYLLNKRLRLLQADRAALEALVANLAAASMRAEAGVAALRAAADQVGEKLQQKVERAQSLSDDLGYMLDRGGQLADRLEKAVRTSRDSELPAAAPTRERAAEDAGGSNKVAFPSRIERELRRALESRR
jgi:Domain of unknown function (DUF6468)